MHKYQNSKVYQMLLCLASGFNSPRLTDQLRLDETCEDHLVSTLLKGVKTVFQSRFKARMSAKTGAEYFSRGLEEIEDMLLIRYKIFRKLKLVD